MSKRDKTIESMMSAAIEGSQIVSEDMSADGVSTADLIAEMTSLKKQIEKQRSIIVSLKKDAMSDPLTNLANRRVFEKELKRSIAVAKRYNRQNALLMVDVDKFKEINDTYGHVAGDEALVFIAKLLTKNTRHNDVVARIGGDEFCVILNELSCEEDAAERARKLTQIISENPCKLSDGTSFYVNVSIGYQIFNGNSEALNIMQHADSSMYNQKDISNSI